MSTQPPARRIRSLSRDEVGACVAELECGHKRHIRHRPPLSTYPWVADEARWPGMIGALIECGRCPTEVD